MKTYRAPRGYAWLKEGDIVRASHRAYDAHLKMLSGEFRDSCSVGLKVGYDGSKTGNGMVRRLR